MNAKVNDPSFKIKVGLSGHVCMYLQKVLKRDEKGSPIELSSPDKVADFRNLITNRGLDKFGDEGNIGDVCFVGSSNTTPAVTDTSLVSVVASENVNSAVNSIVAGNYASTTRSYIFPEGEAEGNLQEIGFGDGTVGAQDLFSRALIKDEFGDPTTLTVLSNEVLTVTWELRIRIPTGDANLTVGGYSITLRPAANGTYGNVVSGNLGWRTDAFNSTSGRHYLYSGALGTEDVLPSTAVYYSNSVPWTLGSYTPGSYTRQATQVVPIDSGLAVIQCGAFMWGPVCYQYQISPTVDKTGGDKEITLTIETSWARDGEL
jgi:hypothetical protein